MSSFHVTPKARQEPASAEGLPAGWASWPHTLQHQTVEQPRPPLAGPTLTRHPAATPQSHACQVSATSAWGPLGESSCDFLFSPSELRRWHHEAQDTTFKGQSAQQQSPLPRWAAPSTYRASLAPRTAPCPGEAPSPPDVAWLERKGPWGEHAPALAQPHPSQQTYLCTGHRSCDITTSPGLPYSPDLRPTRWAGSPSSSQARIREVGSRHCASSRTRLAGVVPGARQPPP